MRLGAKAGVDLEGVICKLLKNMVREDSGPSPGDYEFSHKTKSR
jgi:hypothetical protein